MNPVVEQLPVLSKILAFLPAFVVANPNQGVGILLIFGVKKRDKFEPM